MEKLKNICFKYSEIFYLIILGIFCYLFLFLGLGDYPLIDMDETRYIDISKEMFMSKNFITPFLNYEPFLEKPPLMFWVTNLSFALFDNMSNFAGRFGNAMLAAITIFATYFFAKTYIDKKYALISALILLSGFWFLLFSHITMLDLGICATCTLATYTGFSTLQASEKNEKFIWWAFWALVGASVLMKGIVGAAVPVGAVFFVCLAEGKIKNFFKPVNFIIGLIAFLIVALPWHILVWLENGESWVEMYIIRHHLARFMDSSMGLGRKQPFLFYVPILIVGFLPWTLQLIQICVRIVEKAIKKFKETNSLKSIFEAKSKEQKILLYSCIWFLFGFLFFSISSSKLPPYTMPITPPLALLCGYYWYSFIENNKYEKSAKITSVCFFSLILLIGIAGGILNQFPFDTIKEYFCGISFINYLAAACVVIPLVGIWATFNNKKTTMFLAHLFIVLSVNIAMVFGFFGFMTTFGQTELEEFARITKNSHAKFVNYDFTHKYSVLHILNDRVEYFENRDEELLNKIVEKNKKEGYKTYIAVRNKRFKTYKEALEPYKIISVKKKYSLIEK